MMSHFEKVLGAHDCYSPGDENIPAAIIDRNGDIALALCKVCGAGEVELEEPCDVRLARLDARDEQRL